MIRKLIRIVGISLLALVVIAATGIGVVAWRLYRGPIDADFAVRYIQQGLETSESNIRVTLGKTRIVWDSGDAGVRLYSENLEITDRSGKKVASFPAVAVGVSPAALLVGKINLKTIRLLRPALTLARDAKGGVKLSQREGPAKGQGRFLAALVDQLADAPGDGGFISALQTIEIVGGTITISDPATKQVWRANRLHAVFSRGTRGVAGKMGFSLLVNRKPVRFTAEATYQKSTGDIRSTLEFRNLSPSVFAAARGPLSALANLRMPLSGKVSFVGREDGRITGGSVNIEGGQGWIDAPGVYAAPVQVEAVLVSVDFKEGGRVGVLKRLWVDLGDTTLALNGVVSGRDGRFRFVGGASLTEFALEALEVLWPALVSRNGKLWVANNISGGRVPYLDVDFKLDIDTRRKDAVRLDRLSGEFEFRNLAIRYFGSLPLVRNADGSGKFDPEKLEFTLKKARVSRSRVTSATVSILDLSAPLQKISISSVVDGELSDILRIVDRKPLGFAKKLGVNPAAIGGTASVRVTTAFPLLKKLTFKEVDIKAVAAIRNLSWRKALFGLDLAKGDFRLDVGKESFTLNGNTLLAGAASTLKWRERFGPKSNTWRRQLRLKGAYTPKALLGAGIDMRWFMTGPFGADIKVEGFDDGRTVIDGKYDFRQAAFTVPILNTKKPAGMAASGHSILVIKGLRLTSVDRFTLTSPVITAAGSAAFMPDGQTLRILQLNRLAAGRTNLAARIETLGKARRRITLNGAALDLAPLLKPASKPASKPTGRQTAPQSLAISARVGKLYVTRDLAFQSVVGTANHDGASFKTVQMKARLPSGKSIDLSLRAGRVGQAISLSSDDGGGALRALGIVDVLRGGQLHIKALRKPALKGKPMTGSVRLDKFRIVEAPAIARFFSAAERRRVDKSIAMQRLELGFVLRNGRFYIRGGQAYSSQIGVTALGQIDRNRGTINLRGTFVPLYALNSVFGKIPLFGRLLVGNKGSGLFAANFSVSGSLEKPRFSVNPISILTPGRLREIFNIGSGLKDPRDEGDRGAGQRKRRQGDPDPGRRFSR